MENLQAASEINYTTTVFKNGYEFFQSLAHQLASYICSKKYDEYRLSAEYGATAATIYYEKIITPASMFTTAKYGDKKCVGVVLFDISTNKMILRKTNVDRSIHEFHADGDLDDCFGVQYDIFKYLRDSDIIQIHTIEKEARKKVTYTYRITKMKALKNGRFLHFKGHGTQFFIPIADFKRDEGKPYKKKRGKKVGRTN